MAIAMRGRAIRTATIRFGQLLTSNPHDALFRHDSIVTGPAVHGGTERPPSGCRIHAELPEPLD
jgi:hypothetical protein